MGGLSCLLQLSALSYISSRCIRNLQKQGMGATGGRGDGCSYLQELSLQAGHITPI